MGARKVLSGLEVVAGAVNFDGYCDAGAGALVASTTVHNLDPVNLAGVDFDECVALLMQGTTDAVLGGLKAPAGNEGRLLLLISSGGEFSIKNEDTGSTAANRFLLNGGSGGTYHRMPSYSSVLLWYWPEISRWVVLAPGNTLDNYSTGDITQYSTTHLTLASPTITLSAASILYLLARNHAAFGSSGVQPEQYQYLGAETTSRDAGWMGPGVPYHSDRAGLGATMTVFNGYSYVVSGDFEVGSGSSLELKGTARMEIL